MAAIRTLLNPLPIESGDDGTEKSPTPRLPAPTTSTYVREFSPAIHARKKQKICKDAAVFTRGPVRGECRYPPYEYQDDTLAAHHKQFDMYPIGEIADYPRHIPYNSEKKSFLNKTGRESLEVFQYRFKVPGDDTTYTMLWDYNIGLVRTTPLFKCSGYSKTTPAKMLNRNLGLKEICHSITGGALVAQGYWMPYEAAKAVAATFCWEIRFALTPVFGIDFPDMCIPRDSPDFGSMEIDHNITMNCTEQARIYRELELEGRHSPPATSAMPSPLTPDTPTYPRHIKQLRPKALRLAESSDYSSEASDESSYSVSPMMTPQTAYRNVWTPANTPRSVPRLDTKPPPSRDILVRFNSIEWGKKRDTDSPPPSELSSPTLSPKSRPKLRQVHVEDNYDRDNSEDSPHVDSLRHHAGRKESPQLMEDNNAAALLMHLKFGPSLRKRRAST